MYKFNKNSQSLCSHYCFVYLKLALKSRNPHGMFIQRSNTGSRFLVGSVLVVARLNFVIYSFSGWETAVAFIVGAESTAPQRKDPCIFIASTDDVPFQPPTSRSMQRQWYGLISTEADTTLGTYM